MRISKVKLDNYYCYYDSMEVALGPGINFIVGKNNSGKTTLINALSHDGPRADHRSLTTRPAPNSSPPEDNKRGILFEYAPTEREVDHIVDTFLGPFEEATVYSYSQADRDHLRILLAKGLRVRLKHERRWDKPSDVQLNLFDYPWNTTRFSSHIEREQSLAAQIEVPRKIAAGLLALAGRFPNSAWNPVSDHVFKFDAQRRVPATGSQSSNPTLAPDASNLPQTLRWLLGQGTSFWNDYIAVITNVLPEIKDLRLVPNDDSTATITVDYSPSSPPRPDLGVSLVDCGTGVGQVLAMVYAVMHFDKSNPRIFLIDEPNSFLHPSAIRALLEIFQEHDHHQYIIATHSPTAIMTAQKKTLLLVTRESGVSNVKSKNVNDNTELEEALQELGTKRSDIFGMDAVIWVEGKTDEICFNLFMKDQIPPGVQIIGLVNTGDLEDKKHARLAEDIYEKLSGSVGIMPSTLAFVFDGDKRPDGCDDAKDASPRTCYLKRQTFENYFLDYNGIAEILSELINNKDGNPPEQPTTPTSVQEWIDENSEKNKFYAGDRRFNAESWQEQIDGARFLSAMFKALAHRSRKYRKVKDGEEITKRILAGNPDHFQEIVDLISSILEKDKQPKST